MAFAIDVRLGKFLIRDMLPLSVVIIAKNEANALKASLPPIKDWAKEIIVVINDCTDNTKEVAESFGATVIEHAWEGYAKQRNFAQSCAHEPWILRLELLVGWTSE